MIDTTTIVPVSADFAADGLILPDYRLFRADTDGETRWYYCPETDRYYPSVTSVIRATTPMPPGLLEWYKVHGSDADAMRDERADYGTFLHQQIGRLLVEGEYDLDLLPERCLVAAPDPATARAWYHSVKKDLLSFEAFRRERGVEPIATEVVLKSERGYAGAIDLVCEMDWKKNRIRAVVDFKSGRKGFYESHEIQLDLYWTMWEENFPDEPVEAVFNWSPKDWRDKPTYNLKDQTDRPGSELSDHVLAQFQARSYSPPRQLVVRGMITPDTPIEDLYAFEDVRDRIHRDTE